MGYSWRELYSFKDPVPYTRWRGSAHHKMFSEEFEPPWGRKEIRKRLYIRFMAMPVTVVVFSSIFGYYMLKSRGWLHLLNDPVEGAKEYYNRTFKRAWGLIEDEFRVVREKEAYHRAIEKQQDLVTQKYAKYEEKEKEEE